MSEVSELIAALNEGKMTLDAVANRFRTRSWPRTGAPRPSSYLELAEQAQLDSDLEVPGSFEEVISAYHDGLLTAEQYQVLAQAAADALRAEDQAG